MKTRSCIVGAMLMSLGLGVAQASATCSGKGLELQVLGSGGPEMQDKRASTSYLIWINGKGRVLVDAGGGSALRFGESGAQMADLDVVLFSHLHIDHTADFPALIKSSYFEDRKRPLPVYGPGGSAGNGGFPATTVWVADLFDPARGAYRYLGKFLKGQGGGYVLQPHDVKPSTHEIRKLPPIHDVQGDLNISATPVIHGMVPALGWRVDVAGKSIVFSGDTNGDSGNLKVLARGADLFVAHNAVPEGVTGAPRLLHMPPSVIGDIAHTADVKQLVLSHRMLRSLGHEDETRSIIGKVYSGPLAFADDLDCYPIAQ